MDAERLELPDGAFDRVLCGFGLMFFPKRDQALAEIASLTEHLGVSQPEVQLHLAATALIAIAER